MSKYSVLVIVVIVLFAISAIISILFAIIKGFRAGEAFVEIRIGFICFTIRLLDVSKEVKIGERKNQDKQYTEDEDSNDDEVDDDKIKE